ncbi:Protein of unknown function [Gryllus bimaculatus]|nr:Protein of unknown function [Gryllus bimaculatus]
MEFLFALYTSGLKADDCTVEDASRRSLDLSVTVPPSPPSQTLWPLHTAVRRELSPLQVQVRVQGEGKPRRRAPASRRLVRTPSAPWAALGKEFSAAFEPFQAAAERRGRQGGGGAAAGATGARRPPPLRDVTGGYKSGVGPVSAHSLPQCS